MKRFIISFGLMLYFVNAIFLYCYSAGLKEKSIVNVFLFIPASFFYVLGPTLIDFIIVGIPAWFIFKLALRDRNLFWCLLFVPILLLDVMVNVMFMLDTSRSLFYIVRVALMISCFVIEYYMLAKDQKKTN